MADPHNFALPAGTSIAGHQIERVLGQGGFGKTYVVRDMKDGKRLVLKEFFPRNSAVRDAQSLTLSPRPGEQASFNAGYRSFENEAEVLRALPRHPNIVTVRGLFKKHGTVYMLMEMIEGVTLKTYLTKGYQADEGQLVTFLTQIARGLMHLHNHRLLHRDLKPENIMIGRDGEPVLIDFGAARMVRDDRKLTSVFTPVYAPIEQRFEARQLNLEEGPWTDLFALGVIAYEFATGRRPPQSLDRLGAITRGQRDPYIQCARSVDRPFSGAFCRAVDWALELYPSQRPSIALDWIDAMKGGDVPHDSVHESWGRPPSAPPKQEFVIRPAHGGVDAGPPAWDRTEPHRPAPPPPHGAPPPSRPYADNLRSDFGSDIDSDFDSAPDFATGREPSAPRPMAPGRGPDMAGKTEFDGKTDFATSIFEDSSDTQGGGSGSDATMTNVWILVGLGGVLALVAAAAFMF